MASTACESGPKITKTEVVILVDTHLARQLDVQEYAVNVHNAALSEVLLVWTNASLPSAPSVHYKSNSEADWFYEYLLSHEMRDMLILGSDAHLPGREKRYAGGLEAFNINFSGIVGRETF